MGTIVEKKSVLDENYKKLEFFCVLYFRENTSVTQINIFFHYLFCRKFNGRYRDCFVMA